MRAQEIIAPSQRQRWGATLIALVVAGFVVTRGGTLEPTQAEDRQQWHEGVESVDMVPRLWLESEIVEVDSNDFAADPRSK